MDQSLKKFIEGMPKIELHLHIEGGLEPELAFKLAKDNNVILRTKDGTPYKDAEELRAAYKFNNLQEFLDLYYQGMSVLRSEQNFYDLTMAYLQKVKSQNVGHTEIFFDPQQHMENGIAFDTVINGIHSALEDGEEMGISSKLIMSFLRHLPEKATDEERAKRKPGFKDAFETLEIARPYIEKGYIQGIGLDSSEFDFPPHHFERVFAKARELYPELKLVAHAGEEGTWEFVRDALNVLKVDRIDHGNHALDNKDLIERLVKEGKGLTVCPLSNLKLNHTLDFATDAKLIDMQLHPLKTMLGHRLKAGVNSDDPAYFGGYMNENYLAVAEALNLTRDDIVQLAQNAIDTSFLSPEEKVQKTQELQTYVAKADLLERTVNPAIGQQIAV